MLRRVGSLRRTVYFRHVAQPLCADVRIWHLQGQFKMSHILCYFERLRLQRGDDADAASSTTSAAAMAAAAAAAAAAPGSPPEQCHQPVFAGWRRGLHCEPCLLKKVAQLAAAFACAQRMGTAVAAETLNLYRNKLGTAGVRAIGKVIEAGALPRLEELSVDYNGADDETREWIKTVARGAGCSEVDA